MALTKKKVDRTRRVTPMDYDWLREKYEVDYLTCAEIGKLCDRSERTIYHHLQKAGIETNPKTRGGPKKYKFLLSNFLVRNAMIFVSVGRLRICVRTRPSQIYWRDLEVIFVIKSCCMNALQHGIILEVPRVGCGDCGNEWTRNKDGSWGDLVGLLIDTEEDELSAQVIEPATCCRLGLKDTSGQQYSCSCGIEWRQLKVDGTKTTWAAYGQLS